MSFGSLWTYTCLVIWIAFRFGVWAGRRMERQEAKV